ncbi:MAG: hypothetical protein RIT81_18065 [Deltaproteobacteria bacterium]
MACEKLQAALWAQFLTKAPPDHENVALGIGKDSLKVARIGYPEGHDWARAMPYETPRIRFDAMDATVMLEPFCRDGFSGNGLTNDFGEIASHDVLERGK